MQPLGGARRQKVFDRLAVMNAGAVPDHEQFAWDLAEQLPQERDDVLTTKRGLLDMGEQPTGGRHAADHRQMVARQGRPQHRCLPNWRVGPRDEGELVESRLVNADDRPLLGVGFTKREGHCSSRKAVTAASLRCFARRIGFWTVHLMARSTRLTWAGW